jgi:hypothetical protein
VEFVADESCAGPVIRAMRAAGHDVIAITEFSRAYPTKRSSSARSTSAAC